MSRKIEQEHRVLGQTRRGIEGRIRLVHHHLPWRHPVRVSCTRPHGRLCHHEVHPYLRHASRRHRPSFHEEEREYAVV